MDDVILIYFEQIASFYSQIHSNSSYFVKTYNYCSLNYKEQVILCVNVTQAQKNYTPVTNSASANLLA